jgi:hypothetical protein
MKWEHTVISSQWDTIHDLLRVQGAAGWELVTVLILPDSVWYKCFFKRRKR